VRRSGPFALIVLGAVLSLGPVCDGEARVEDACQNLCECLYFLPSEQEDCQAGCLMELAGRATQECIECIANADCFELQTGRACVQECPFEGRADWSER
jgi:hypothetical protein